MQTFVEHVAATCLRVEHASRRIGRRLGLVAIGAGVLAVASGRPPELVNATSTATLTVLGVTAVTESPDTTRGCRYEVDIAIVVTTSGGAWSETGIDPTSVNGSTVTVDGAGAAWYGTDGNDTEPQYDFLYVFVDTTVGHHTLWIKGGTAGVRWVGTGYSPTLYGYLGSDWSGQFDVDRCPTASRPPPTPRPTPMPTPRPTPRPTLRPMPKPTPRPTLTLTPSPTLTLTPSPGPPSPSVHETQATSATPSPPVSASPPNLPMPGASSAPTSSATSSDPSETVLVAIAVVLALSASVLLLLLQRRRA